MQQHDNVSRRGFTLTELLVAVIVLLVVIAATSKIFGTVSRITAVGEANQALLQEAGVIQRLFQSDIKRLSRNGFMAVRNVEVRNDVHQATDPNAALLNPILDADARIRADQLVFFRSGYLGSQSYNHSPGGISGDAKKASATAAMIYYGHGYQLPGADRVDTTAPGEFRTHDAFGPSGGGASMIPPWYDGVVDMRRTLFKPIAGSAAGTDIYTRTPAGTLTIQPPDARQWVFARQQTLLGADEDTITQDANANGKTFYLQNRSARSIFMNSLFRPGSSVGPPSVFASHEIRNGRMDIAATRFNEIDYILRRVPEFVGLAPGAPEVDNWLEQRLYIRNNVMHWPRAERFAPSMHRLDQMLTTSVLGTACSDLRIEWTWETGTGAVYERDAGLGGAPYDYGFGYGPLGARDDIGAHFGGDVANPNIGATEHLNEQPWFGLPDAEHNVNTYDAAWSWGSTTPGWWMGPMPWWRPTIAMPPVAGIGPAMNNVEMLFDDPDPTALPGPPDPSQPQKDYKEYLAIFGQNDDQPVAYYTDGSTPIEYVGGTLMMDATDEANLVNQLYTPWPSALRITMTLHDPELALEYGREFQFVVALPDQAE